MCRGGFRDCVRGANRDAIFFERIDGSHIKARGPNGGRRMKHRATREKVKNAGRLPALRATDTE